MLAKIKLINFKKHENAEFSFPIHGLTLLDGKSGAGKTTILKGIIFALYGKSKHPINYGAKSCLVEFHYPVFSLGEYLIMNIKRGVHPAILELEHKGNKYQGEAAQYTINKIMGQDEKGFSISCCLLKKGNLSVLSMTPVEQLKFIQSLTEIDPSLNKINPVSVKTKIKNHIQVLENELVRRKSEIESTSDLLCRMNTRKPPETLKVLPRHHSIILSDLEKEKKRYNDIKFEYNNIDSRLTELKMDLKNIKSFETKLVETLAFIKDIEKWLSCKTIPSFSKLENKKTTLSTLEKIKQQLLNEKALNSWKKNITDQLEKLQNIPEPIDIEKCIIAHEKWLEYSKEKEKQDSANIEIKEIISTPPFQGKGLKSLKKIYNNLVSPVDKCPFCRKHISIVKGKKLQVPQDSDKVDDDSIKQLQYKILKLQPLVDIVSIQLIPVKQYTKEKLDKEKTKSKEIDFKRKKYEELTRELQNPPFVIQHIESKFTIDTIDYEINKLTNQLKEISSVIDQAKSKKEELAKLLKIKENLESKIKTNNSDKIQELENKKSKLSFDSISCGESLSKLQIELTNAKDIENWKNHREDIERLEKKIDEAKLKIQETEESLAGFKSLEQDTAASAVLAVQQVLNSINSFAKVHLEKMFDIPLVVELDSNEKKIRVNVIYQGYYTSLDDLSDGEYQRCELAFCLAVNDLVGGRMLLMDECINHLGSQAHEGILYDLKNTCPDKTILVISHQDLDSKQDIYNHILEL